MRCVKESGIGLVAYFETILIVFTGAVSRTHDVTKLHLVGCFEGVNACIKGGFEQLVTFVPFNMRIKIQSLCASVTKEARRSPSTRR